MSALPLSNGARTILRACKNMAPTSETRRRRVSLYADASPAAQTTWQGGTLEASALHDAIGLSDFRVLGLGLVYDSPGE